MDSAKTSNPMRITVLGAGAWGTTLAKIAHEAGHELTLWGHPERLAGIAYKKENTEYLPDITLPDSWRLEADWEAALDDAEAVIVAVPSSSFRVVASKLDGFEGIAVTVTKGIENSTGLTMGGILNETAPEAHVVALSGPSLAAEVARNIPTALVAASEDGAAAATVQEWLHRPTLRVYTSADVLGVELGGALKNVMAIAAGACDGLQLGDNAKAALITRGLREMRRLGMAAGAQPNTFNGLSGMGDLTVTCFSKQSRNRTLGERIAKGEPVEEALASATAEGHPTAKSARALAQTLEVETPIIEQVHAMLYGGKAPHEALKELMKRERRGED